jgi:branched-chain amino acid transport system permease protein
MLPGGVFNTNYGSEMAIVRTRMQWVLLAAGIALLFSIPLFASSYWLTWLTKVGITIVAVLGLHILTGLCGQVSMGQAAFMGVGAYAVAILTTKVGLNGWLCLPISALSAGLVGLVFGLPCFRLKGFYLVISTMAASFIIIWCFKQFGSVTGGFVGIGLEPLKLGPVDLGNRSSFFCLTMGIMIAATLLAKNIQRTAPGRAFVAIRDNELAAEVSGIPVFRYKMLAFFIGCVFAGVSGWLWAYSQLRISPDQFRLMDSMWYLGMLVIGGWGSTTGVFFGVVSLRLLEIAISDYIAPPLADAVPSLAQQIRVSMSLVVNGLVIIIFIMVERRGLYYRWQKLKAFYRLYPYSGGRL